jgi:hypothetical protein
MSFTQKVVLGLVLLHAGQAQGMFQSRLKRGVNAYLTLKNKNSGLGKFFSRETKKNVPFNEFLLNGNEIPSIDQQIAYCQEKVKSERENQDALVKSQLELAYLGWVKGFFTGAERIADVSNVAWYPFYRQGPSDGGYEPGSRHIYIYDDLAGFQPFCKKALVNGKVNDFRMDAWWYICVWHELGHVAYRKQSSAFSGSCYQCDPAADELFAETFTVVVLLQTGNLVALRELEAMYVRRNSQGKIVYPYASSEQMLPIIRQAIAKIESQNSGTR